MSHVINRILLLIMPYICLYFIKKIFNVTVVDTSTLGKVDGEKEIPPIKAWRFAEE